MISHTTKSFWKLHRASPTRVQRQAKAAYVRFHNDPYQAGLQFKQVHEIKPIYSAHINRDYRVIGVKNDDEIVWF